MLLMFVHQSLSLHSILILYKPCDLDYSIVIRSVASLLSNLDFVLNTLHKPLVSKEVFKSYNFSVAL